MKLFKLPSPVDLGRSKIDALPSREWTPDDEGYCWEDYDVEIKKLHPVKYFFIKTIGGFLEQEIWWRIRRPVRDAWYWIVSHIVPSRRHHILDLRQPKRSDEANQYRYGWLDTDHKMLYALFNLLNLFVKNELPSLYYPSKEEIEKEPHMQHQADLITEIRTIHWWWNIDRKDEIKANDQLLNQWSLLRKNKETRKNGEANKVFQQMKEEEDQKFANKEDEMIARLMKIRRRLWS